MNAATLGDLTSSTRPICYGVLKPGERVEGGVPLIRVTDISGNYFNAENLYTITKELDQEFRRSRLQGGEILISIQGTIGRVAICPDEYAGANISRTIAVIDADDRVSRQYLYRYLRFLSESGEFHTVGSTRASLNISTLRKTEIPLPPVVEQNRIAGILDAADALRAKRRESLDQLDSLLQSTFLDMFGDPVTNPMRWEVGAIGNIAEVKGGKRLPKGEDYSEVPTDYRYIRVSDLRPNDIQVRGLKYLKPDTQTRIARYIVAPGDVIISIAGTIGITAAVPEDLGGANLTENAAKIVFRDCEAFDAVYISYALQMPHAQFQIAGHTGQVTIGKLALFRIRKITVPLPPIELQNRFATIVESIEQQKATQRDHLDELDLLFASLQSRAFRGDL